MSLKREECVKCAKNAKIRSTRVQSRAVISVTRGPSDKRPTQACRELNGLKYAGCFGEERVPRGMLGALALKNCRFRTLFRIGVGAQQPWYVNGPNKRSSVEQCTGLMLKIKRKPCSYLESFKSNWNMFIHIFLTFSDYIELQWKPEEPGRQKLHSWKALSFLINIHPKCLHNIEK